jgi:hypothetical protein
MLNAALEAVNEYRRVINNEDVYEVNKWISDDFLGYFGYYQDRPYEVYTGESYRKDNIETLNSFIGKKPFWEYEDLHHYLRAKDELILSSIVHFYLSGKKVASSLAMEVFNKEAGGWKLYRQHMEGH